MKTLSRTVVFTLVGALGFGCQLGVLHVLVGAGLAVGASTALAVLTAVVHNFLWHRRWTWRDRAMDAGAPHAQFLRFVGLNGLVSLAGNVAITAGLAASGLPVLAANVVAVVVVQPRQLRARRSARLCRGLGRAADGRCRRSSGARGPEPLPAGRST